MPEIAELARRIQALEAQLETELAARGMRWRYRVEAGRVRFEKGVDEAHARLRKSIPRFLREGAALNYLSAPLIYSVLVPLVLIDLWGTLYQWVCFPVYGIPKVRRGDHVVMDRHQLAYLNGIEKMNCLYCGYANGVVSYAREIAGRTEQYWCPIKHARRVSGTHSRYARFLDFGDAEGYRRELAVLRRDFDDLREAGLASQSSLPAADAPSPATKPDHDSSGGPD